MRMVTPGGPWTMEQPCGGTVLIGSKHDFA